jgi:hypothetical protein
MISFHRRSLALVLVAVASLAACKPVPSVPRTPVPPAPGAVLEVDPYATRGQVLEVGYTGCADDFQYAEVRLVVGDGAARRSVAVTSGWDGGAELAVPRWTPPGPTVVEASCLEPNLSGASDGADIVRFDYAPVPVAVDGSRTDPPELTAPTTVTDGVLRLSGSGCPGRALVAVARGPWQVASAASFRFGRTLVTAAADGTWSAEVPLRYAVGSFSDPVAPGPMTAFVVCEGWWYPAATFEVAATSPAPAVHLVGPGPSLLYLSQCPAHNTLSVLGVVEVPGHEPQVVVHQVPGPGDGEVFQHVAVPAAATSVTWVAGCWGPAHPRFTYAPVTWSAP